MPINHELQMCPALPPCLPCPPAPPPPRPRPPAPPPPNCATLSLRIVQTQETLDPQALQPVPMPEEPQTRRAECLTNSPTAREALTSGTKFGFGAWVLKSGKSERLHTKDHATTTQLFETLDPKPCTTLTTLLKPYKAPSTDPLNAP